MESQPESLSVESHVDPTHSHSIRTHAYIAETLDKANIPNVMIGYEALILYGVEVMCKDIDFLIPDGQVGQAVTALVSAGFRACEDPDCLVDIESKGEPAPGHVHIHNIPTHPVCLHEHSSFLWRVPCLDPSETGSELDIMYATDDSLPWPPSPDLHPIRIPSVHRFLEASVLKYLRITKDTKGHIRPFADLRELRAAGFPASCFEFIFDVRYNVYKYLLHSELLPPSIQHYARWMVALDYGRKKPKMSDTAAMTRLYRETLLEEAELQASKTAESSKEAEEHGT